MLHTFFSGSATQAMAAAATPAAAMPAASPAVPPANAQRTTASTAQPARAPIIDVALGRMLVEAVQRGNREQIAELLAAGVDVNTPVPGDGSALIAAAQRGHLDIVQSLLDRGADIHKPFPGDGNPLIAASQRGHVRIAQLLVSRGANVNSRVWANLWQRDGQSTTGEWRTPLSMARRGGHAQVVACLLAQGARE